MGLIRAAIITAIVYFTWKFIQYSTWMKSLPPATQCTISPWIPMTMLFIIELLM
jgi:hypothetical protein